MPKDRSRDDDVIDDAEHTDPDQPDIGKQFDDDDSDPIPDDDDLDVGDLDDLVAEVDPHVKGDDD